MYELPEEPTVTQEPKTEHRQESGSDIEIDGPLYYDMQKAADQDSNDSISDHRTKRVNNETPISVVTQKNTEVVDFSLKTD